MPKEVWESLDDFMKDACSEKCKDYIRECRIKKRCTFCDRKIVGFTKVEARGEYDITGLCEECQDKYWGE